jgi:hypothetical protein
LDPTLIEDINWIGWNMTRRGRWSRLTSG